MTLTREQHKQKLALFRLKVAQLTIAGSIAIEQDRMNPEQSRQASARCARYLDELGKMLDVDKHLMDIKSAQRHSAARDTMTEPIDLRHGDWESVLADVEPDCIITDPPYGARTHTGHDLSVDHTMIGSPRWDTARRRKLDYVAWTPDDVDHFVDRWHERTSGWICAMSCSDLMPFWRAAFHRVGRASFAPVACVIRAMSVRLGGDGPASWVVYLNVARPRGKEWKRWGALPGAYVTGRGDKRDAHIGGKPVRLMNAIIRDYSRAGDLVCDPCAGYATTAVAAAANGRCFVGAEVDEETYESAIARLANPQQGDLFG